MFAGKHVPNSENVQHFQNMSWHLVIFVDTIRQRVKKTTQEIYATGLVRPIRQKIGNTVYKSQQFC